MSQDTSLDAVMMFEQIKSYHKDFMDGLAMVRQAISRFNEIKQGNPGLPGKPGRNGSSATQDMVASEVRKLYQQPKDGVSPTVEEVANAILNSPKIFRYIKKKFPAPKDGQTPEMQAIVSQVVKSLQEGALGISHVAGLEGKFGEVFNALSGKIYGKDTWARGGGDTVAAGSGVTITTNSAGKKVISASSSGLSIITVSGTIDDSNVTFTSASEPTLLCISGGFYKKTGGAFTWTYVAGTITISSPIGTGGSIFGI